MKTLRIPYCAGLALASLLLARAARAQHAPVAPLAPVRTVAIVPKPAWLTQEVPRTATTTIRLVCRSSAPSPPALFLLNSRILVGQQTLGHLNPRDIIDVQVYKSAAGLPGWPAFTSISGIIDLKLKPGVRVPSIALSQLKHRLHLTGAVQFEQCGQLLPAGSLRIAKADANAVTVRVIEPGNTRVVLPVEAPPPTPLLPPGATPRVMVRGVARQ